MGFKNILGHTYMESNMIEKTDDTHHASMYGEDRNNVVAEATTEVHHHPQGGRKRPPPPLQEAASIPANKEADRNYDDDDEDDDETKESPKKAARNDDDDDETKQSPKKQSDRRSPKEGVWVPDHEIRPTDVLCGRYRASRDHAGNKFFRQLIGANRATYTLTTSRTEKTRIATQLVSQVIQAPRCGRFLKRNDATNRWHQVDHTYAHDKVSHALRSAKDLTIPRPRKKRTVVILPPTDQEEALFLALYADQQQLFASSMMMTDERSEEEEPTTTTTTTSAEARTEATRLSESSISLEANVRETEEDATSPADRPVDFDAYHSWLNNH